MEKLSPNFHMETSWDPVPLQSELNTFNPRQKETVQFVKCIAGIFEGGGEIDGFSSKANQVTTSSTCP